MQGNEAGIRETLRRLVAPPDESMRGLGASGERAVARLRFLLSVLALPLPLVAAASGAGMGRILGYLGVVVAANGFALLWLVLARRRRTWLPYATRPGTSAW